LLLCCRRFYSPVRGWPPPFSVQPKIPLLCTTTSVVSTASSLLPLLSPLIPRSVATPTPPLLLLSHPPPDRELKMLQPELPFSVCKLPAATPQQIFAAGTQKHPFLHQRAHCRAQLVSHPIRSRCKFVWRPCPALNARLLQRRYPSVLLSLHLFHVPAVCEVVKILAGEEDAGLEVELLESVVKLEKPSTTMSTFYVRQNCHCRGVNKKKCTVLQEELIGGRYTSMTQRPELENCNG
jgi:hypothetical protein